MHTQAVTGEPNSSHYSKAAATWSEDKCAVSHLPAGVKVLASAKPAGLTTCHMLKLCPYHESDVTLTVPLCELPSKSNGLR